MATNSALLSKTQNYGDLKRRLIFLLLALLVYRFGAHVPVSGINPAGLQELFGGKNSGVLNLFNMFSSGALSRLSVFALGIMPYISASIVMQMMTYIVPYFEQIKNEGESGRKKIAQYTRYAALVLALFQSLGIALALEASPGLVVESGFYFRFATMVSLTSGSIFLMWLGEQITERGLGNGISILIFAGIVAGLPSALNNLMTLISNDSIGILSALFIFALVIGVTFFVVFMEKGQRKILINYARRQVGNKVYGGQSSYLPLKFNTAGVIPPIFASSIILLPTTLVGWFGVSGSSSWLSNISSALQPGQPIYILLFVTAIVFFAFFYTGLVFNSREISDNLKKSGALVPGYRPGEQTSKYLDKVLMRLTLIGALYVAFVCLVPEFLIMKYKVPFYFGGTSLLILVVVTIDFMAQVQTYLLSQRYDSLLKKNQFKTTL